METWEDFFFLYIRSIFSDTSNLSAKFREQLPSAVLENTYKETLIPNNWNMDARWLFVAGDTRDAESCYPAGWFSARARVSAATHGV